MECAISLAHFANLCGDRACGGRRMQDNCMVCMASSATFCRDRACRAQALQPKLRLRGLVCNPLWSSWLLSVPRAGRAGCVRARAFVTPCRYRACRARRNDGIKMRIYAVDYDPLRRSACQAREK